MAYLTFLFVVVFEILFLSYAPWCPACQNLQPEWESFAEWGEDLEVNVGKVDVTEQTGTGGVWFCFLVCIGLIHLFILLTALHGFENMVLCN